MAGGSIASRASEALEPVVLQLKWRHAFQFAGYYAALERCYYREAGLDVSLQELTNNQSPTDLLLAGSAQLGLAPLLVHTRRLVRQRTTTLAERESYLRAVIDVTPLCVKTLDVECNLLSMNRAGLDIIHARAFAGENCTLQFSGKSLDGRHIWLETFAVPFRNDAGTVTSVLAVTIDITRRKQMEITLQEQHDQLQNLLNSINGISWEFDLTTNRFTYVSPNSPRILSYSIHEWTDMDSEVVRVFEDSAGQPLRIAGFILDQTPKEAVRKSAASRAENGSRRPTHRRHCPRFQQYPRHHPGQP